MFPQAGVWFDGRRVQVVGSHAILADALGLQALVHLLLPSPLPRTPHLLAHRGKRHACLPSADHWASGSRAVFVSSACLSLVLFTTDIDIRVSSVGRIDCLVPHMCRTLVFV